MSLIGKSEKTPTENDITLKELKIIPNDEYEVFSSILLQQDYSLMGRFYIRNKIKIESLIQQIHMPDASSDQFEEPSLKQFVIKLMTVKIEDDTYQDNYIDNFIKKSKDRGTKLDVELYEDFKNKNSHYYILQNKFSVPQNIVLLSKTERDKIFTKKGPFFDGWFEFYNKYPDSPGYIGLSRVGFNTDHTYAIVYFSLLVASLIGHGYLILLSKEKGKWSVKKRAMLWIS